MKKRPDITEATREKLKAAFWQLYATKSIEKITIKEITDLAGYNRGTFYLYFQDVYDVLTQIEDELLADMDQDYELLSGSLSQMEFQDLVKTVTQTFEKHRGHMMVLLGEHGDPGLVERMKEKIKPVWRTLYIDARDKTEQEVEYILECCIAGTQSAVTKWFENNQDIPVERLITLLYDTVIRR